MISDNGGKYSFLRLITPFLLFILTVVMSIGVNTLDRICDELTVLTVKLTKHREDPISHGWIRK